MATNPLFTVSFDVKNKGEYGAFIKDLRLRLGNPKHFSHDRPVLPPVDPKVQPRRLFHVVLRTQTSELTLATRADDLYLECFRSSDGTWWKFNSSLIPGATDVGFDHSYGNLLGHTDNLVTVKLGPDKMTEAVDVLAARTRADLSSGPKQQQAKDKLAVLLLMVHEATRFLTVSKKVSDLMHSSGGINSGEITSQMKEQVTGWRKLSAALLKTDVALNLGPHGRSVPAGQFTPFENMDVMTAEKASKTLGILLFVSDVRVPGGMTAKTALNLSREN